MCWFNVGCFIYINIHICTNTVKQTYGGFQHSAFKLGYLAVLFSAYIQAVLYNGLKSLFSTVNYSSFSLNYLNLNPFSFLFWLFMISFIYTHINTVSHSPRPCLSCHETNREKYTYKRFFSCLRFLKTLLTESLLHPPHFF